MNVISRAITGFTLVCFITTQNVAIAGPHEEGTAAGQAANPFIQGSVNTTSAVATVPGYTSTPPETALYGQPGLAATANARLAACIGSTDPICQAQVGALSSANTPRTAISPYDPAVTAARDIARNPSAVLGSLASFYSGCSTAESTTPAGSVSKLCNRYSGIGNYTARRDLTVQVDLVPSCASGTWFAHGQVNRNGADSMVTDAQCRIRADGLQSFRFYASGGMGACIGWQTLDLPTTPATQASFVTNLSPHWQGYCWSPFQVVMMPGSGCSSGNCNYSFQFGTPKTACPTGTVAGDTLSGSWGGADIIAGPADQCFTLAVTDPVTGCALGSTLVLDATGSHCASPAGAPMLVGAVGWTLPLSFVQPTMSQHETDLWVDNAAALQSGGRCTVTTAERCVDGPSTKVIDSHAVTRACWSYERTLSCSAGAALDECAALTSAGCTPGSSLCKQMNTSTGLCEIFQDTYRCPVAAQPLTSVANCPANVYCLGTSCFNTSTTSDTDFARAMTLLEAAREAGVYLDTTRMQVFRGEANNCRDQLLQNCCTSNAAGAGMSNQSLFGVGSRLVYDILMNADNRQFITQGMQALLMSGGFSGAFTSYGVTVAVNGTALPAGSAVL